MNNNFTDPSIFQRVQLIAVGVHNIADRLTAPNEALGTRLRHIASSLIEDAALFSVAQKRDALGANQIMNKIFGHIESLRVLLGFLGQKGLVTPMSVDIVLWHINQAALYFQQEDYKRERHENLNHPHGAIVSGSFEAPRNNGSGEPAVVQDQKPAPKIDDYMDNFNSGFSSPKAGLDLQEELSEGDSGVATALQPDIPPEFVGPYIAREEEVLPEEAEEFSPSLIRRQKLVKFFQARKQSRLKEVLALFPDLSEKTIRNDLLALCENGVIRRVGSAPQSSYVYGSSTSTD